MLCSYPSLDTLGGARRFQHRAAAFGNGTPPNGYGIRAPPTLDLLAPAEVLRFWVPQFTVECEHDPDLDGFTGQLKLYALVSLIEDDDGDGERAQQVYAEEI